MARGVGGGGGGYRSGSGGYKSSSSKSSSSSGRAHYKPNAKDPNAPNEVRVRSAGALYKTFSYSTEEFQNEYMFQHGPGTKCKKLLGFAVEDTLCEGGDSENSRRFRSLLKKHCGMALVFDAKKGPSSTSSV